MLGFGGRVVSAVAPGSRLRVAAAPPFFHPIFRLPFNPTHPEYGQSMAWGGWLLLRSPACQPGSHLKDPPLPFSSIYGLPVSLLSPLFYPNAVNSPLSFFQEIQTFLNVERNNNHLFQEPFLINIAPYFYLGSPDMWVVFDFERVIYSAFSKTNSVPILTCAQHTK